MRDRRRDAGLVDAVERRHRRGTRKCRLDGCVAGAPQAARALLETELPLRGPIRLMGLTLSGLEGAEDDKPARDEAQLRLL